MTGEGAGIDIRHLHKAYGQVTAVDDVSFSVAKGEIFGLLGPNGAGKPATELRHCLGRQAGCRSPGQRPSFPTQPPSWTYRVCQRSATCC